MRHLLLLLPMLLAAAPARVPLVYSTDLFHPHDDPDDHLDLATVFALPEFDLRAVLLDQGDRQKERPGSLVMEQMAALTGRKAPYARGLIEKLRSPSDTGANQPAECQGAVELLLRTLRASRDPVVIIQVGSSRDIVAAFNRDPVLFRSRVKAIYANIGNIAVKGKEWNVQLDPHAYVGLIRSGLPVYLCPCFPQKDPHATFWKLSSYRDTLDRAPLPLQNFFLYALHKVDPKEIAPDAILSQNLRPWRHSIWPNAKEMWSTASILDAAGRREEVFRFVPASIEIGDDALVRAVRFGGESSLRVFERTGAAPYEAAMNACIRKLFAAFPLAVR